MSNEVCLNTRFHYLYRDASNYKDWGSVVFAEAITTEMNARLLAALESAEFFIAGQIRVPEVFLFLGDWPLNQDDHCWHAFAETELTNDEPDDSHGRTIRDLVSEIERASREGWKIFDPMVREISRRQASQH